MNYLLIPNPFKLFNFKLIMDEESLRKLIKKKSYQVFLFASPVPIPYSFAQHYWFVVNLKGKINRWEFGIFRDSPYKDKVGVVKNLMNPWIGMNIYYWRRNPRFESKLITYIEGGNNSIAKKMALFIEKNAMKYPLRSIYSIKGPNSNTFAQWIINKFPESKFKLGWRAFGKEYKLK